jgi:hypothetical protein
MDTLVLIFVEPVATGIIYFLKIPMAIAKIGCQRTLIQ